MTTILLVEDEKEIADLVSYYLKNENYTVISCATGTQALEELDKQNIHLAILDVMLPDLDGFEICRKIRETQTYPIIMLTAKGEEIDKITGLTIGADDYMTKPFKPLELIARVKAQLRRVTTYNGGTDSVMSIRGLFIDLDRRKVLLDDEEIYLTPLEFSILKLLCENKGQAVSSEGIFQTIWGEKYYTSSNNTIMVHIRHLREKMKDSVEKPKYIKTVWGVGYKIE
ncbi:VanR-ABDEGLN family response regulator transcription factor [Enterococcus sp. CWB-B31]|uniref:VanR-ABDEGLN family response regulator transcription factor n=1 Tax=Enterococcus sp. CWB-B31 TaxID=2885159 RepID=UPI001E4D72B6|nr:VanR-ABDEGLN family response regulator transcription factor [Enterococcus sp. CWB-B31]MCB5955719.1 VanR-ABDEGLN family response regulator transcription factor [Enterococcus sp. CWB-B31]